MFLESLATNVPFVMQHQIHVLSINHSKEISSFNKFEEISQHETSKNPKFEKNRTFFGRNISAKKAFNSQNYLFQLRNQS